MKGASPFVPMSTNLRKDERVSVLAEIAGMTRREALGALFELWAWCTDRGLQDAPDWCEGYAVTEVIVCRFLGESGLKALLADGCDDLALGRRTDSGLIYLKGTSEQVSRRRGRHRSSSAGGKAQHERGWRAAGRFVSSNTTHTSDTSVMNAQSVVVETTIVQPSTSHFAPSTSRSPAEICQSSAVHQPVPATDHRSQITDILLRLDGAQCEFPDVSPKAEPKRERKPPSGDHAQVVKAFCGRYEARTGAKYAFTAKDGQLIKRLLASLSVADLTARIGVLFDKPPAWLQGGVPDIGTLSRFVNQLAPKQARKRPQASPEEDSDELRRRATEYLAEYGSDEMVAK